jgi:hypothetical protein
VRELPSVDGVRSGADHQRLGIRPFLVPDRMPA